MGSGFTLKKLNWDKECRYDLVNGRGFRITELATQKKTRKEKKDDENNSKKDKVKKSMYGIHSPIFCSDWSDDDPFVERYSCSCGDMRGKIFEDDVCPSCNTKIIYRDVDLSKTGWIILEGQQIIHPIMYKKLESAIGSKIFKQIITFDKKVSLDGELMNKVSDDTPFYGIGIPEFKERFTEIIAYYWVQAGKKKSQNKLDLFEEISASRDIIFTSCIPVYSSVLRLISHRGDNFCYTEIDKKYNAIVSSVKLLNDKDYYDKRWKRWNDEKRERMDIPSIVTSIQIRMMELWKLILGEIQSKTGHIRAEIIAGMIDFASRCEIVPDPLLKADEVRLSYIPFIELFKFEIIGCLMKSTNVSESVAFNTWFNARVKFSEQVYAIMKYIIKKTKPRVTIHRNPVINYGSMICCKVIGVDPDWTTYILTLPDQVLPASNADFDGDVTCITSLKTKSLAKEFDKFYNPRKNMFISRDDGLLNSEYNLYKDQIIALYDFNNI